MEEKRLGRQRIVQVYNCTDVPQIFINTSYQDYINMMWRWLDDKRDKNM